MNIRNTLSIIIFLFLFIPTQPVLSQDPSPQIKVGKGSPQFRAIAGVSMGGYGAMNIGLSHPDTFTTMACLGGLLDMAYLLKFIEVDMLGNYDAGLSYPNHLNYFAQDPLTLVKRIDLSILQGINLYLDAGTEDEFQFDIHTDNFADAIENRGLPVRKEWGFPESFPGVSHFDQKRV